jgi:hypothetical protein
MMNNTSEKIGFRGNPTRSVIVDQTGEAKDYVDRGQRVTVVPLCIRRRHTRKLIIRPNSGPTLTCEGGETDQSMIVTLSRAFYWQKLLDDGEFKTVVDLAKALRLEIGWVAEVLRMTLLAPDIVQAVLDGRQPRNLNLHVLRGREKNISRVWETQRQELGFSTPKYAPRVA